MIISISGPCMSGKSTILSLLKDQLTRGVIYETDIFKTVWEDFTTKGFTYFSEVIKDRDFTIMYISKLVEAYLKTLAGFVEDHPDDLVIIENCYLDYLIYAQINSWYHYPLVPFLESTVDKLLKSARFIDRIYITTSDDLNYPMTKDTILECKTIKAYFKRNRGLECRLYDIYRNQNNVVSLPTTTLTCDSIIISDLKKLNIV